VPLCDHFRPPVSRMLQWTTLYVGWATRLADRLNERWLPPDYVAWEQVITPAHPAFDISSGEPGASPTVPRPDFCFPLRDHPTMDVEVHVFDGDRTLLGVIAFVGPTHVRRPSERRGFVANLAGHVYRGRSVVVIDPGTDAGVNLHNEFAELLEAPAARPTEDGPGYVAAYRPKVVDERCFVDVWRQPVAFGQPLPTMPMRLTGDTFVPIEFEETYVETCRRRKLL